MLKGVSLDIEAYKATVLADPSGSGKTNLLRCVNLLEMPNIGNVHPNGDGITFGKGSLPDFANSAAQEDRHVFPLYNSVFIQSLAEMPVSATRKYCGEDALLSGQQTGIRKRLGIRNLYHSVDQGNYHGMAVLLRLVQQILANG